MTFFGVIGILGQLVLFAMGAVVIATALVLTALVILAATGNPVPLGI